MSSSGGRSGSRERQRGSLLFPIIGGVIGFIAALFLLRELDIFEGDPPPPPPSLSDACTYPVGSYHDQLCNLVARATEDIQSTLDAETAERCVAEALDCRVHRENLRLVLLESERLRDGLFVLDPPEQAEDWHGRYLTAIAQLHSGFNAQFSALRENDRDVFLAAHERTLDASEESEALFDDFQIAFTDLRQ